MRINGTLITHWNKYFSKGSNSFHHKSLDFNSISLISLAQLLVTPSHPRQTQLLSRPKLPKLIFSTWRPGNCHQDHLRPIKSTTSTAKAKRGWFPFAMWQWCVNLTTGVLHTLWLYYYYLIDCRFQDKLISSYF